MREAKAMGRPREFDAEEALAAIMEVFWIKGFEGASLSDLVSATGLKKGSLYAAFGDKRAMYGKALALYDRTRIAATVKALSGAGAPLARIDSFLQAAVGEGARRSAAKSDPRGCFVCNAAIDQAPVDGDAERQVQASLARMEAALEAALAEQGAETGVPASALRRQARHLMSVYFGLRVLAKAGAAPEVLKDAKDTALGSLVAA